jgi:hypothetical protein
MSDEQARADGLFDADEVARHCPACPVNLIPGLERYVNQRIETGTFLRAVLENDLATALRHADDDSIENMRVIVGVVYNHVPSIAWGSKAKVRAWLERKEVA